MAAMADTDSHVKLYTALEVIEASLLEGALESQGIPCERVGGAAAFTFGETPAEALRVELWVAKDDAARAREVLEAELAKGTTKDVGADWSCSCGEANGANFEVCWSCGANRPS